MKLLLDTCAFLWLALESDRLSAAAVRALNDPANTLLMSDVSIWEIVLKHSRGKLPLPAEPQLWIPSRMAFFQTQTLPIFHAALFRSGELPRIHNDPFDRLIAAQAIEESLTIISPDEPHTLLGASRIW